MTSFPLQSSLVRTQKNMHEYKFNESVKELTNFVNIRTQEEKYPNWKIQELGK